MDYLAALNGIPSTTIDEWSTMEHVTRNKWVWRKAKLWVCFHYIPKSGPFWDGCNKAVLWRSRLGRPIQSHSLQLFAVRDSFLANDFKDVTLYWQRIEVTRGCGVKLPMVSMYRSREPRDPKSGW